MRPGIQFKCLDASDADGSLRYQMRFSNGETSTTFIFYGYEEVFKEFAEQLTTFPQTISQTLAFVIGEEDKRWAYYLQVDVYCYEVNGDSCLRIRIWTNGKAPYYQRCEFFIFAHPAALNRLGQGLSNWNPRETVLFKWKAD